MNPGNGTRSFGPRYFRSTGVHKPANPAFTMSENRIRNTGIRMILDSEFQLCVSVDERCDFPIPVFCNLYTGWWSRSGSNRRPQACKARALPTELRPHSENRIQKSGIGTIYSSDPCALFSVFCRWWARDELNVRPHAYQACALTT